MAKENSYATIQIRRVIKDQIVEYCNNNDLKIGRYIERLFLNDVSGSMVTNT